MNLNEMVHNSCNTYAKDTALIFNNNTTMTYKNLNKNINKTANTLLDLGVKKGDRIVLLVRNSPEFIISYFAVIRVGAIVVPINFLLKAPEIEYILMDSKSVGIITHCKFFHTVKQAGRNISHVKFFIVVGDSAQIKTSSDGIAMHQAVISYDTLMRSANADQCAYNDAIDPETVAMFIYTSGTTGKPKGVMLSHKNLISNVHSCIKATNVSHKDKFLCILPMFHSFAWLVCVLIPLTLGAPIVIIESIQPFGRVMKSIFKHKITLLVGVPQIFSALTNVPFFKPLHIFVPIRLCISGAAPLPAHILEKFQEKFSIPLIEGYGLTETSPVATLNPVEGARKTGSVGVPIPDVSVKIINEQGDDISDSHKVGEICIKGPNVMIGYYEKPEETAKVLSSDGWLKTGDMGNKDAEGYLYIIDRKKDLIISKGLNIYPKEIEDVLITHRAIQEAAVIGLPLPNGDEVVLAYVTLKEGKTVEKKELTALCRKNIASYKVPREINIIDELPKNTLGKVLKTELRAKAAPKYK